MYKARPWLRKLLIIFHFFLLPIIVSVVCPTGPHPPLRLARRPNRGHVGDPLLRYMPMIFFIASGSSTSTLINREVKRQARHYLITAYVGGSERSNHIPINVFTNNGRSGVVPMGRFKQSMTPLAQISGAKKHCTYLAGATPTLLFSRLHAKVKRFGAHPMMPALARLLGACASANPNDFHAFSALPSAARKTNFPSGTGLIFVAHSK